MSELVLIIIALILIHSMDVKPVNYSAMYCEQCSNWYIPKNIGEMNKCPMCGNKNVHGG